MDEQDAIHRLQQGDLSGLEELVTRYQTSAVHAAYLILFDRESAEDVVQAAFLKVAERFHQFDSDRPFAPWFFRIVINDSIKVAKRLKQNYSLDDPSDELTAQLTDWLKDKAPGPEIIYEQKEIREQVLSAIHNLPVEYRSVVVMRYLQGINEADMSVRMHRPISTIKYWLREARKRMFHLVNDFEERGSKNG